MRITWVSLAFAATAAFSTMAHARTVTLDKWMPTVRLCPISCISVSGHKLRNGNKVNVLEIRKGWVRISPWLDAERLKRSFGDRVPKKPAYWVELARTGGLRGKPETKKDNAKKTASRQRRQQRRITLPAARPAYRVASVFAAEDSMMASALKVDRQQTAAAVDAALIRTVMARSEQPRERSPVAVKLSTTHTDRALSADSLTTDKMASWIEANRGSVVEEAQEIAAAAALAEPKPEEIKMGRKLEVEIASLKALKDEATGLGSVPDVMTSELLDKRLNILPGMNSNIPEETVIALRHYALGLLNSKACKGIAGGGAGEKAGTIYLVCTDDLTRIREFSNNQELSGALN